tara:strand:+ start:669 stop:1769 length:1101 start_codon:yes stop_codon:yes gene_type:complete
MKIIFFIKIFFISLILFLLLDVTIGKYINKKFIQKDLIDVDTSYGKSDSTYDHRFSKNYNSIIGWGNLRYRLCTDNNSFRISCNKKRKDEKNFDIAFIGDSFTEGLGYDYEKTFVGLIESKLKNKKIANLAMTSYSPSIYLSKINYLIDSGYKFREVIVFLDLSDLPDDVLCYQVDELKVKRKKDYLNCYNNLNNTENKFSKFISKNFKISILLKDFINDNLLDNKNNEKLLKSLINHSRSEWTYNYKKENFNNMMLDESTSISINHMNNLHILLKKNSIDLSVAVYPWPGTLKNDSADNLQVKIWKKFCELKCKKFYNFMPAFFSKFENQDFYKNYKKYFITEDIHYNQIGNKLIADEFFIKYVN